MKNFVSEIKISYKSKKLPYYKISGSIDSYSVASVMWDKKLLSIQEEVAIILLNSSADVIGFRVVHTGGVSHSVIDFRLIASIAVVSLASAVVLIHNHPSGNLKPSSVDIDLTKNLKNGLNFLGIKLIDHLIIGPDGGKYFSFVDNDVDF